jgi:glutamate transport system substrate-binding protein
VRTNKRSWVSGAVVAVMLIAAACGGGGGGGGGGDGSGDSGAQPQFDAGTTMAELQDKGKVTIGVKYDVPPFGFKNPQTGDVEGFDVDMGKIVAQKLGVEPEFIEAVTDNRIPFLEDGTVDIILSTMTITTDRDAEIDYSRPYFIAHGRILVPKSSDIQGIEDLGAGTRVCTALGSTYETTLSEGAPEAELELVDSYSECTELLANGAIDAISTDDVILTGMIIQDDTLKLVGDELTQEPYGAGIKKGNTELVDFVNATFEEFKTDGRYDETYEKWVGQYTDTEPEPPTISVDEAVELVKQNEG